MTVISEIEALAAPARLDRFVERMRAEQPTLTDISAVLQLMSQATDIDVLRLQALAYDAARALGKFDAETRYAPADELAAVVRDAQAPCAAAHLGCVENVLPWSFDGRHCSPSCKRDNERTEP